MEQDNSLREHIEFARTLVHMLDTKYKVFGIKFGIDPLFDFIPGAGNFIASCASLYLFWIAYRVSVPHYVYVRMLANMGVDFLIGSVPFIGIVFDALYRANVKNFALIEKYVDPSLIVLDAKTVT